jgi:hypothetical protein
MADDTKFKFSLDNKEFMKKAGESKQAVGDIGDPKLLKGLVSGIKANLGLLAGMTAAALAVKKAIDFTVEGEKINALNQSFDALSNSIGVAADTLREELLAETEGLIDQAKAIELSNKAMIQLGKNAKNLPQIMDLAHKSSTAMGADMEATFNSITQAIASGSAETLKMVGLNVDAEKAMRDYAKSIGATVDTLTLAGKQTAVLNAALDAGKERFKDVDTDVTQAGDAITQMGNAWKELGDTVKVIFANSLGPTLAEWAKGIRNILRDLKEVVEFNSKSQEDIAGSYDLTIKKLAQVQVAIEHQQDMLKNGSDRQQISASMEIKKLKEEAAQLEVNLDTLRKKERVEAGAEKRKKEAAAAAGGGLGDVDLTKVKAKEIQHQKAMLAIKKKNLAMELQEFEYVRTEEQIKNKDFSNEMSRYRTDILKQEQALELEELALKKEAMLITEQQFLEQMMEIEVGHDLRLKELKDQEEAEYHEALDRKLAHSESFAKGQANAFKRGAEKNRKAMTDWGKTGDMTFKAFGKHSEKALLDFGSGAKTAGEAMRGFMFGAIADVAQAKGMEILLASIWPPNPLGMAAGGGLVALAGALRSQGQGSKGVPGGAGGGGGGAATADSMVQEDSKPSVEEQKQKSVTVQVQGDYFETEETKTRLLEMIRESTDATDFKYTQIGE